MTRWSGVSPRARAVIALSVTGIVANAAVFATAVAGVGPQRPCVGALSPGIDLGWLVAAVGAGVAVVVVVARRVGASVAETALFAFMQLSLSLGLAFLADILPLQADANCPPSFF